MRIRSSKIFKFAKHLGKINLSPIRKQSAVFLTKFATDVFLRLNGWKLEVDPDETHAFPLERGECDFERLLPWIRAAAVRPGR